MHDTLCVVLLFTIAAIRRHTYDPVLAHFTLLIVTKYPALETSTVNLSVLIATLVRIGDGSLDRIINLNQVLAHSEESGVPSS